MIALLPLLAVFLSDGSTAVRIGFGESRPYIYKTADGKAGGFVVEVFNEAARREGLRLAWTRTGSAEENTAALAQGRLDILPLAVAFPDRKALLFVSEVWWSEPTILLTRTDASAPAVGGKKRLSFPERLLSGAQTHYANYQHVATPSAPQALEEVCRGKADAALVGSTYVRQLVNARPDSCQTVHLQISDSDVTADFSIIANRKFRGTAERLRRRVTEMTADGTLASIAGRHPPISTPHATRMAEALRTQFESQRLRALLLGVSASLLAGLLFLFRQVRTKGKLRLIIDQQTQTAQALRESQAILSQRTEELIRSNEDLQAFAYSVSHDLQEPLRNQCLYSELLEKRFRRELPLEARDYLQTIRNSALRMHEMMTGLLGYSRAGQTDRLRTLVDCTPLVNRVLEDLRLLLYESGASVEVGPLPTIPGWEDRLQQVFQNLIQNAAKYRKDGVAPRIVVAAVKDDASWLFSVSDNGIGLKQQYAEQVFGLFKRLHPRDLYGGSGVGLALCRRVVERHDGRIWIEGEEGVGTTVYFTLPSHAETAEPCLVGNVGVGNLR